eukprot:NODE_215_length_14308_cov_0.330987.p2 type:complete len:353 gc:universal NODE_215_length_14308_cov_0.330987:10262-9204(-)
MSDWSVSDVEEVMPILNPEQFEEHQTIKQHYEQLDKMEEADFVDFDEQPVDLKPSDLEWKDELELYLKKDLSPIEVYYCQCLCVLINLIDEGCVIEYHPIIDLMVKIKKHMNKQTIHKKSSIDSVKLEVSEEDEIISEVDQQEQPYGQSDQEVSYDEDASDECSSNSELESIHSDHEPINFDDLVKTDDEDSDDSEEKSKPQNKFKRMINNIANETKPVHVDLETVNKPRASRLNDEVTQIQQKQLEDQANQFSSSDEEDTFENKLSKLMPAVPTLKVKELQRSINYAILKNRQFKTGKRSINSNPRVRKKAKFAKANKKIKSIHAVYSGKQNYQGELTGINDRVVKSVSFQ